VKPIRINGVEVPAGERAIVDVPIANLYTHTPVDMPVQVIRGRRDGPCMFVSAALHGDEINGVEIIRRLSRVAGLRRLRGTLITIPIVNVFGFLNHSRYLPDRRDLNRSFPGSERGSLAARLANTFLSEVVDHCSYGIDLHTATGHRVNLPHIRANLDDADTDRLARVFGVPVVINTNLLDGSLRRIAADRGVTMLLYEGGEALRFDEWAIRAGLNGILAVMRELGMLPPSRRHRPLAEPAAATGSSWVRAPRGGIVRTRQRLGAHVAAGDVLGVISDTFGTVEQEVRASFPGIIIGKSNLPLANEGDALFHIARFDSLEEVAEQVEAFSQSVGAPAPELDPPPS